MKKNTLSIRLLIGLFIMLMIQACKKDAADANLNRSAILAKDSLNLSSDSSYCSLPSVNLSLALKMLEDSVLSEESAAQIDTAIKSLNFEEIECFNKALYDKALTAPNANVPEVNYWREWSSQANRIAFRKMGKGFFALTAEERQAVSEEVQVTEDVQLTSSPNERLTSLPTNVRLSNVAAACEPWKRDDSKLPVLFPAQLVGKRVVTGIYIGRRNLGGNSPDCDYAFEYKVDRIDHPVGIGVGMFTFANLHVALGATEVAKKTIDANPKSDCGYFLVQIMIGAGRVNALLGGPINAQIILKMAVNLAPNCGWCYTGSGEPGSTTWYWCGTYIDYKDGIGTHPSNVELNCSCTYKDKSGTILHIR